MRFLFNLTLFLNTRSAFSVRTQAQVISDMPCPVCTFWKLPGLALRFGTFPNLVMEALGNLRLPVGGGHLFQEGRSYET